MTLVHQTWLEASESPITSLRQHRVIAVNLTEKKVGTEILRVTDSGGTGRLECAYHINDLLCPCIARVIYNNWDAGLIWGLKTVRVPFGIINGVFTTELTIELSEETFAGNAKSALLWVSRNALYLGEVGERIHTLGYLFPEDGRLSLLQAFTDVADSFASQVIQKDATEGLCSSIDHNFAAQHEMLRNLTARTKLSRDKSLIEASSILVYGRCTLCQDKENNGRIQRDAPTF